MRRLQKQVSSGAGSCSRNKRSFDSHHKCQREDKSFSPSHLQLKDSRSALVFKNFRHGNVLLGRSGTKNDIHFSNQPGMCPRTWCQMCTRILSQVWLHVRPGFGPDVVFWRTIPQAFRISNMRRIWVQTRSEKQLKTEPSKCDKQNSRLCLLMFKSTELHHCREHRIVLDPTISLQREEECKRASEESEIGYRAGLKEHLVVSKIVFPSLWVVEERVFKVFSKNSVEVVKTVSGANF